MKKELKPTDGAPTHEYVADCIRTWNDDAKATFLAASALLRHAEEKNRIAELLVSITEILPKATQCMNKLPRLYYNLRVLVIEACPQAKKQLIIFVSNQKPAGMFRRAF
jgi:hypothetical protein